MKKVMFCLCLGLAFVTACANQSSSTTTSSSKAVVTEVEKVTKAMKEDKSEEGGLSQEEFEEFADAALQVLEAQTVTAARIAPANNGVMKTSIDGTEQVDYRTYQRPSDWEVHPRTADPERDVVYTVSHGGLDYIIMFYPLNAYASSPLDGGDHLTDSQVADVLEKDGQDFIYETTTKIGDQTWNVGYQEVPENTISGLTFYRLENTGNFDDSLWVANVLFAYNIKGLVEDTEPQELIGQVKAILEQVSQGSENPSKGD